MSHIKLPLSPAPEPTPAIVNARTLPASELRRLQAVPSLAKVNPLPGANPLATPPLARAIDPAALTEARQRVDARLSTWVSASEREALAQALVRSPAEGEALLDLRAASFGLPDAFTLAAEKRAKKSTTKPDVEGLTLSEAADVLSHRGGNDAA